MNRREGWPSFWGVLFGLLLSMAAMLPHVTFALAVGGALHCPPQNHTSHDMATQQDRREPMPRSLPAQLMPLQICCGLLSADEGPSVQAIAPSATDADYAVPATLAFASRSIPPEPPPPRC